MKTKSVQIKEPMWKSGGIVGIADRKFEGADRVMVEIIYRDKFDKLVFPNLYIVYSKDKEDYPTKVAKGGVVLRIIPIKAMEELL